MTEWIEAYGLFGLFGASFLAATLVPLSSEAALAAGLAFGIPAAEAVAVCSVGNSLACLVNYGLGRWLARWMEARLQANRSGRRALAWLHRFGPWSLLASWLPVVGDPLTVAAGLVRVRLLVFALVVIPLRVGRYLLIAAAF